MVFEAATFYYDQQDYVDAQTRFEQAAKMAPQGPLFAKALYYAGDTCLFSDMRLIGALYHPAIAFLPIGDRFTMDPMQAAMACEFLGVKQVVPMHWGTFPLLTGTPAELKTLVEPRGVQVLELKPGETTE